QEMIAAAVLRRLEVTRVNLERDLAEAQGVMERCDADATRNRDEAERLEALKQDAQSALNRLTEESAALGADDGGKSQAALKKAPWTSSHRRMPRSLRRCSHQSTSSLATSAPLQRHSAMTSTHPPMPRRPRAGPGPISLHQLCPQTQNL